MVQQVNYSAFATAVTQATTTTQIQSPAQELPHALGTAKKKKKKRNFSYIAGDIGRKIFNFSNMRMR